MNKMTFKELYNKAPKELQEYVDRCAQTPQSKEWHPEGNVRTHTVIVYNRAKKTGDINLMLAAFFHDLGKADTTQKSMFIPDKFSAKMHEYVSSKLVEKYKHWIEELGGNTDIVYYVVSQHMRAKQLPKMRQSKQEKFKSDKYFQYVEKFGEFDDMLKDYSNDLNE